MVPAPLLNDGLVESAEDRTTNNDDGHLDQRNLAMSHSGGHMRALLVDHQKVLVIFVNFVKIIFSAAVIIM